MFTKLPNQKRISILLVKIAEVELSPEYTDEDRYLMIQFYKKRIRAYELAKN